MEDTDINNPQSLGVKATSVNVASDLHKLAKEKGISFKDAIEFGIMFKLADADGFGDYPPCNIITILQTNIAKFQQMLNEANEKIEQLEGKEKLDDVVDQEKVEDAEKETDDVFGGIVKDE